MTSVGAGSYRESHNAAFRCRPAPCSASCYERQAALSPRMVQPLLESNFALPLFLKLRAEVMRTVVFSQEKEGKEDVLLVTR